MEFLIGLGFSWAVGGVGMYLGLAVFSLIFPRLFRFVWYLTMFPLSLGAFAFGAWIFLPMFGIGDWSIDFYKMLLVPAVFPALWFCSPSGMGPGAN